MQLNGSLVFFIAPWCQKPDECQTPNGCDDSHDYGSPLSSVSDMHEGNNPKVDYNMNFRSDFEGVGALRNIFS